MEAKGRSIEMLTPRDMPDAPSLFLTVSPVDVEANRKLALDPVKGAMFHHPKGTTLLTSVRVVAPSAEKLPPSAKYVSDAGAATFEIGPDWLMEATLDDGKQGVRKDLRPTLPLVIRY